jgi:hypothetical protein
VKKILAITLCFAFMGMGSVLAQIELPKHSWDLGTEISHIKYKEPGLMEEEGMMYGIVGSYTYRGELFKLQRCMLKAEGKSAWGQVDYTSPISGSMNGISDWLLELRGLAGYDFEVRDNLNLTPYLGIGYRYLNDDSSGKKTSLGALGYERESNYIYIPIGAEITTPLKNWLVGATLEYDIFIWGKQISHLTDVPGYLDDAENTQKKGYGIKGSVKFQKKGEKLDFVIEPFIRYWNIKKSEETKVRHIIYGTLTGYEPKNSSTEFGIKLAVKF